MSFGIFMSSIGVGAGIFFAAVLLLRDRTRSPATIYVVAVSLVQSVTLADYLLEASGAYSHAPALFGIGYFTLPLFAPLIWLHVAALADPVDAGWKRARPHLFALALPLAPLIPFLLLPDRWLYEVGPQPPGAQYTLAANGVTASLFITLAQMTVYLVWVWRRARGVVDVERRRWVRGLTAAATLAWLSFVAGVIAAAAFKSGRVTEGATNAILVLVLYGFALYSLRSPPDPLTVPPPSRGARRLDAKYARSALTTEDGLRLLRRAEDLVSTRAVHRDPMLTLARLSSAAGASPNDMSQALNEHAGGFHAWLAGARVRDVEAALAAQPDANILDAAYAAGFNAKSTFYDAFRRAKGISPAEWRARQSR